MTGGCWECPWQDRRGPLGPRGLTRSPHPSRLAPPSPVGQLLRAASCPSGSGRLDDGVPGRCLLSSSSPRNVRLRRRAGPAPVTHSGCMWFATVDAAGVTLCPAPQACASCSACLPGSPPRMSPWDVTSGAAPSAGGAQTSLARCHWWLAHWAPLYLAQVVAPPSTVVYGEPVPE